MGRFGFQKGEHETGKRDNMCKGRGCEGAWHIKEVRAPVPEKGELEAWLQKRKYAQYLLMRKLRVRGYMLSVSIIK